MLKAAGGCCAGVRFWCRAGGDLLVELFALRLLPHLNLQRLFAADGLGERRARLKKAVRASVPDFTANAGHQERGSYPDFRKDQEGNAGPGAVLEGADDRA
eukprot:1111714-Rhodomonas_salina.1